MVEFLLILLVKDATGINLPHLLCEQGLFVKQLNNYTAVLALCPVFVGEAGLSGDTIGIS